MTINVLRSTNSRGENEMMKLIRYDFAEVEADSAEWNNGSQVEEEQSIPDPETDAEVNSLYFPSKVVEDDEEEETE